MPLYVIRFLEFVAMFTLLGWSVYLPYRSGQIYYGGIVTMMMGSYASAYLVRDLGLPFGLALLAAIGIGAAVAYLIGRGIARLGIFTTIIATIALIFITQTVIRNLEFLGGVHGFFYIPGVPYLGAVAWTAVVIIGFFIYRLDHSRIGRALEVTSISEDLSSSLGVDIYRLRVFLQTFAGIMGAIAGVIYAFAVSVVTVTVFSFSLVLFAICFVFVGGRTNMWGTLVFAPILWSISIFLPPAIASWKNIIYGGLLVLILILRPEGVIDRQLLQAVSLKSQAWLKRLKPVRKIEEVS